jgi:hypothetical protein
MHKITVVWSAHRPNGRCNAEELLKIIRAIEPRVVFEEVRDQSEFDAFYKQGFVEAHAITKYREYQSFQHVPVDRYDTPQDLPGEKLELDLVFDRVQKASEEYRALLQTRHENTYQHGFEYLKSAAFAKLSARLAVIEDKIVNKTADQRWIGGLEKWRSTTQSRDVAMVGNIYDYCRTNEFDTGVFIVGAAHKAGILKEIEQFAGAEADLKAGLISWNL